MSSAAPLPPSAEAEVDTELLAALGAVPAEVLAGDEAEPAVEEA